MSWQTVLTLVPSVIAVIVAIAVPFFTFRLALRQDLVRRLRDRRADLYVDLLTEAIAEQRFFEYDIADDDTQKRMRAYFHDLRLPPLERARLGSRGTIFASRMVNRLFVLLQGEAASATLPRRPKDDGERLIARMNVGKAFDELETAVRREMGADEIEPRS
jgi:hypothetical protein